MASNQPAAYGRDIRCIRDADGLLSSVVGIDVVVQAAIHRITTPSVLGPGGDDWGEDAHRLLGMPQDQLTREQPLFAAAITKDDRVETADVTLTAISSNGKADVLISVIGTSALGPFEFVKPVSELTSNDIERQAGA